MPSRRDLHHAERTAVSAPSSRPVATGAAFDPPAWFDEIASSVRYADHVVLSGNVRDLYPVASDDTVAFVDMASVLNVILNGRGLLGLLIYDPVDGFRAVAGAREISDEALQNAGVSPGHALSDLHALAKAQVRIAGDRGTPSGLVIDYASHLHGRTADELEAYFIEIDKASKARSRQGAGGAPLNSTIWLVDHLGDLPDWFCIGNDRLREVQVELPNLEDRFLFAKTLGAEFGWDGDDTSTRSGDLLQQFALECDGETLVAMRSIAEIAQAEGFGLDRISEAIRVFRMGTRRNPWKSPVLRDRIRDARQRLEARIKGQPHAIEKTLEILVRSIMGLSDAQSGARHHKPRGVLFFAGPTGVGKTELGKGVTELLFGDEAACHRYDMSEFMTEGSVARLIGAPPGQPGHERGGALVNDALRRPFSVFLFDEIEKAHPRVLDLFLQILDEGRLSDARGAVAHFSEALIIFTSNIGIVGDASETNMGMNVLPSDSYAELQVKVTRAIEDHFRTRLKRPELLNRLGQNIVIFEFLSPRSATAIFDALLGRVLTTVKSEHGIDVTFDENAYADLRSLCIHDYFDGGRGIGNRIETHFTNPISKLLFERETFENIHISDIRVENGRTLLTSGPRMLPHDSPEVGA